MPILNPIPNELANLRDPTAPKINTVALDPQLKKPKCFKLSEVTLKHQGEASPCDVGGVTATPTNVGSSFLFLYHKHLTRDHLNFDLTAGSRVYSTNTSDASALGEDRSWGSFNRAWRSISHQLK